MNCEHGNANLENSSPSTCATRLIGGSPEARQTQRLIERIARVDVTVLIEGETGTGKEIAARAVHDQSARRGGPFIPVNCASIPEALFEGELFGYVRGAFTGSSQAYPGKLRLARGGTVLLDEIGEMAMAAQSKLLRVLESREVFPLGATRSEPLDVRVVAATNRNLESLVEQGTFRADLFYRLNVARLTMPALRDRRDDIPALFAHFVREMSQRTGESVGQLGAETLEVLMSYSWPGNVRELRNVVEALFIDAPAGTIELQHLPPNLVNALRRAEPLVLGERARIISALCACRWNRSRAAEQLQWSRMTLYRKMKKLEIEDR